MAEPQTPTATQAADAGGTSSQADTTTSSSTQAAGGTKAPLSADEYERQISDLRKEAAGHRTKLKAFEDAEAQRQAALLSDQQKLEQRATAAEKQINEYKQKLVQAQVKLAAQQKGIIDPDLAALALSDKLEYGDDGMPTNLDKALNDLLTQKPFLAPTSNRPTPSSGGATNPGRAAATSGGMTWEYAQQILSGEIKYDTLPPAQQAALLHFMRTNPAPKR